MQTSDLNANNTESDHANAIFRQFQDFIFSRERTYVKTLSQWANDITGNRSRVIFSRACADIFASEG